MTSLIEAPEAVTSPFPAVNLRSGVGTRTRTAIVVEIPPAYLSLRACRRFRQAVLLLPYWVRRQRLKPLFAGNQRTGCCPLCSGSYTRQRRPGACLHPIFRRARRNRPGAPRLQTVARPTG